MRAASSKRASTLRRRLERARASGGPVRQPGDRCGKRAGIPSMTLLALERVCKRHQDGRSERVVLDHVSMSLHAGELVAVWGMRGSGRSTLLRIAAGIEPPDAGVVRFAGRELAGRKGSALGEGIGYCQVLARGPQGRPRAGGADARPAHPRRRPVRREALARGARARRRRRLRRALRQAASSTGPSACASPRASALASNPRCW